MSASAFHFVILGDRTGDAQPGVFEQVLREAGAEQPAFLLSVGDMIQGLDDSSAEREWGGVEKLLAPYRKFRFYLSPGNHDVWSEHSEALFRKHSGRALHYAFDYEQAHFTVLDNSRTEQFATVELEFLESDLRAHLAQPVKFIVSHRPSWILDALMKNPGTPLQKLAKRYGVKYIIAGHLHQTMQVEIDGVTYLSVPSAGGHLRASKKYDDGWFFAHTYVSVSGNEVSFQIREVKAPLGQGRTTAASAWGMSGLVR